MHDTINIDIKLGFYWQMTHVECASYVIHLHNIEQWESVPYNTKLGSKEFLI